MKLLVFTQLKIVVFFVFDNYLQYLSLNLTMSYSAAPSQLEH